MSGSFSTPPNKIRRLRNVDSPASSVGLLTENDDAQEKRDRRRSKILANNILSPGGVQSSPIRTADRDKRKSISLTNNGMSNAQIKEHYSNCIKLSSENKINAKNAFGLHLIDYMKDLLKQSQKEESGTNFQIASCTLDAGVKIYAYRVDSVHSEAYKVLSSLGRADDPNKNNENDDNDDGNTGSQDQQKQAKQKKKFTGKTIETNMKNINCESYDLEAEIDPYFHKIQSGFDEGGTAGLSLFQLHSKTNDNDLIIDSAMKFSSVPTKMVPDNSQNTLNNEKVESTYLKEQYDRKSIETKEICPQFKSFQFLGWDKDISGIAGNIFLPEDSFDDNVHRFDVNAPVIPEPADIFEGGDGGDDMSDYNDGDPDNDLGPIEFDDRDAEMLGNFPKTGIIDSTTSSILALSLQSEYSYFNQDIISTWAGPLHWKVRPLSKEKAAPKIRTRTSVKVHQDINFDDEIDFKKLFTTGRGTTYLKESTLERYAAQMTILPTDLHYQVSSLYQLFLRTKLVISEKKITKELNTDNDGDWYNYDNKNDREGFCPIVNDNDGGGDYDDDDDYDNVGTPGGDLTLPQSQPPLITDDIFAGEGLVAPPDKVRVLDINYAKAAKRIDIKKLKSAMWDILCTNEKAEKENAVENNNLPKPDIDMEDNETNKGNMSGVFSFKEMYHNLPKKISKNMAKSLSGPISFVCLLYLSNEKNLKLNGTDDMNEIWIEEDHFDT